MKVFGSVPAQPGDTVRPKDAERILAGEMLQELRHLRQTTTEQAARLASQVTNGVLEAGTWPLDANGQLTRGYHVAIGSISLVNGGPTALTVSSAAPGPSAPTSGAGVHIVQAWGQMVLPLDSHAFTLYGTPGTLITYSTWTGLQPFGAL